MNLYSKLLKQLNMCGHAVLVTDYPSSDTSDGTAASAVCHQTSRKTILSAVPGQMKPTVWIFPQQSRHFNRIPRTTSLF